MTDVQFSFTEYENCYIGKTIFVLNGKKLLLMTSSDLLPPFVPFETSSHLVVAVKRTDNDSLKVIACYIKNEDIFVGIGNGGLVFELLIFGVGGLLVIAMGIDVIKRHSFSGLLCMLFGMLGLFLVFTSFYHFFEYRKALQMVKCRLHRISLLEKRILY